MSFRRNNIPAMCFRAQALIAVLLVLAQSAVLISAQGSNTTSSKWQTLDGGPPYVIAHGGFSGLLPSSSLDAYNLALLTSVPDLILWCDVQLTKDGAGICFPNIQLQNSSDIQKPYPGKDNKYDVDGVEVSGYFSIDFTLKQLANVTLTQGIYSRAPNFDGSMYQIQTVEEVFQQTKPPGFWLNVEHPAFYAKHNLSMRSFLLRASKSVIISHISSPDLSFLGGIASRFSATKTKLIFHFLKQDETEPSSNQTYGSLLGNLTLIKTFAAGILVPKTYIWPVDSSLYLQPHTSLVTDAHKIGLEVYAADFANDNLLSYNYSYNPVSEYVNYVDNGDFSVDGVLSDFPITPSEAFDCFAHVGKDAAGQAAPLVISHFGASGDYPGCTDLAYNKAISDGADIIDCPVQMSKDGVPFCLPSVNLMDSTTIAQTMYINLTTKIPALQSGDGIFSFSLTWKEIQDLTPLISNPFSNFLLNRNPAFKNAGKLVSLSDFLALSKNSTTLSGVLIIIENAAYLAEKQGLSVTDAVTEALGKAGYNKTTQKVMIQSANSSVLKKFKGKSYDLVYEVDETIRDATNSTITEIKSFASSVLVAKGSVYSIHGGFLVSATDVVPKLHAFNMSVYAKRFANEFVSQAWDFFSDPIVELNTFSTAAGVDGVVTDYPQTAVSYRKNRCLTMGKNTPSYMLPVQAGGLLQLMAPAFLPPAAAPAMVLSDSDVSEPPLPDAVPLAPPPQATAQSPATAKKNGQSKVTASALISSLSIIVATALLCG